MGTHSIEQREHITELLIDEIAPTWQHNKLRIGQFRVKLAALSDSTLDIVHATAEWSRKLPEPLIRFMEVTLFYTRERIIRETMFYRPLFSNAKDLENVSPTILPFGVVHGLHQLESFKDHEHLEALTGKDLDTALAFMNVTAALHRHTDRTQLIYATGDDIAYLYIADTSLHDLIAAHPDKGDEITSIIQTRKTGDAWLISDCLADGTANHVGVL